LQSHCEHHWLFPDKLEVHYIIFFVKQKGTLKVDYFTKLFAKALQRNRIFLQNFCEQHYYWQKTVFINIKGKEYFCKTFAKELQRS
jgi:hypothetical protein